jgi:uncharacterized protein (TIGR02145 family)
MKLNLKALMFPFALAALLMILANGCKKDSTTTPQATGGTVTDIDGNVYKTVTIGTQTWMAENLKTSHFRNGTAIPNVSDSVQWAALTTAGYCFYNNDNSMIPTYGLLYNWAAVTDSNNIAPQGWHVPTDAEWSTLVSYLGSSAGGMLKSTGTTLWLSPNTGATNQTGFNGLPGGDRSYNSLFHYIGMYGCWWCATENTATTAWEYVLKYNSATVTRMEYSKGLGLSLRCIKD